MILQIISVLHQIFAILSFVAWALAMYYWALTNSRLNSGVPKMSLINPINYFKLELFTPLGLKYRRSSILCFAGMLVLGVVAFLLRSVRDAIL